jgi:hypothetical protein
MIIKPFTLASRAEVKRLSAHLLRTDENEVATVANVRGIGQRPELADMLESMHRTHHATAGKRGLFHVAINPDNDNAHTMTGAEWQKTLDTLEAEFGLQNQPRVLVLHHKIQPDGSTRPHIHALYQIADVNRGRQVDDFANSGRRCGRIARELEKELNHRQLAEHSPTREYDLKRHHQAKREGKSVDNQRQEIADAWTASTTAAEFQAALRAKGYDLAGGEKARVLLITPTGNHVGLNRELKGVADGKDIKKRLEGHKLEGLEAVKQRYQTRQQPREAEKLRNHTRQAEPIKEPKKAPRQETAGLAQEFADTRRDQTTTDKQRAQHRTEQFKDNQRDTKTEREVTPDDRAATLAAAFAENQKALEPEQSTEELVNDHSENAADAFEARYGKKSQAEHELTHEIEPDYD